MGTLLNGYEIRGCSTSHTGLAPLLRTRPTLVWVSSQVSHHLMVMRSGSLYIPHRAGTTPENSPNLGVSILSSEPSPDGDEIRVTLHTTQGWYHSWELTQPWCEYPLKWTITSWWWDQGSLYIPHRAGTTTKNSPNLAIMQAGYTLLLKLQLPLLTAQPSNQYPYALLHHPLHTLNARQHTTCIQGSPDLENNRSLTPYKGQQPWTQRDSSYLSTRQLDHLNTNQARHKTLIL